MCDCDSPYPAFFNERLVKSQKRRDCSECGRPILFGETYQKVTGKWQDFCCFSICLACVMLWADIKDDGGCICYGDLRLNLSETR